MDIQKKRKRFSLHTKPKVKSFGEAVFVSEKGIFFQNSKQSRAIEHGFFKSSGTASVMSRQSKLVSVHLWQLGKTFDSKHVPVFHSSEYSMKRIAKSCIQAHGDGVSSRIAQRVQSRSDAPSSKKAPSIQIRDNAESSQVKPKTQLQNDKMPFQFVSHAQSQNNRASFQVAPYIQLQKDSEPSQMIRQTQSCDGTPISRSILNTQSKNGIAFSPAQSLSQNIPKHWREEERRQKIAKALSAVSISVQKAAFSKNRSELPKVLRESKVYFQEQEKMPVQCELHRTRFPQIAFEKYANVSQSTERVMHDVGSIDAERYSKVMQKLSLSQGEVHELFRDSYKQIEPNIPEEKNAPEDRIISKSVSFSEFFSSMWRVPRLAKAFALSAAVILGIVSSVAFVSKGIVLRGQVLGVSKDGYDNVLLAVESVKEKDFSASDRYFEEAHENFARASHDIEDWAGIFSDMSSGVPFFSAISSGKNALSAAGHLALAGKYLNGALGTTASFKNPFQSDNHGISMMPIFSSIMDDITHAREELVVAQVMMDDVHISDVPEDKRDKFLLLKNNLPVVIENMESVTMNGDALMDMLGENGPRKYLFLFQNNNEMRPTGGFIGSYGFLDVYEGSVRKFFVNGIFDPDGQLSVNMVPPQPIQKISAAWSLHDSNWFPDFPVSAEKAIFFYEKTGGPTVDGVIAVTPELLRQLLEITGPVYLEQHDTTVDANNFIEKIQHKVEVDYDKAENKPKQILSDLAPILLEKTMQLHDSNALLKTLDAVYSAAREKHILFYSRNEAIQKLYSRIGWSGEIRSAPADFVEVVHANINGFKTDGVIEETISHSAEIQTDGSVTDTVSITRKHNGGDTPYDWWNRVNADFMRVYVPKGSQLISVSGQTREVVSAPLDYDTLGFKRDADIERIEGNAQIDPESGTRIYEESGKTVFGNWVYISPKESVTVTYVYKLPFSVRSLSSVSGVPAYSLLAQKQSGTLENRFESIVHYPLEWKVAWSHAYASDSTEMLSWKGDLRTDTFLSAVFEENNYSF